MGSSQSSHADKHGTNSVKRSSPEGVRGRKSPSIQKGASVPHLRASVVSLESRELTGLDVTAEESVHEDDVYLHPVPVDEHVLDSETDLESSDEEDEDDFESGDEGAYTCCLKERSHDFTRCKGTDKRISCLLSKSETRSGWSVS